MYEENRQYRPDRTIMRLTDPTFKGITFGEVVRRPLFTTTCAGRSREGVLRMVFLPLPYLIVITSACDCQHI